MGIEKKNRPTVLQDGGAILFYRSDSSSRCLLVVSRAALGLGAAALRLGRRALASSGLAGLEPLARGGGRLGREDDQLDAAVLRPAVFAGIARQRALIGIADHGHAEGADLGLLEGLADR